MTTPQNTSKILYGGDYNPEQWPPSIWDDDYSAFDQAAIDTLTVGTFSWSMIQPDKSRYDFSTLDQIIQRAVDEGRHVVLSTATGAMPPWLVTEFPEVARTDFEGRAHVYGQRHNHCPNSTVFAEFSGRLAGLLAERYSTVPDLVAWHVGNEYGGACYCQKCAAEFRKWLQKKYGSLDSLNESWNTTFWSHRFSGWDQIVPPNALSEHWKGPDYTAFQGITLDYMRFMSDSLLANFRNEKKAIRNHDKVTPVTTNFMGPYRPIDYHRWAESLDFVSWDNYPASRDDPASIAFGHDLMRGIKQGQPFWIMEQSPSITASRDVNPVKRPGVLRLWSWQAVAHGADAVLYFQMRQSRGACEKYHGAVLDHSGRTDTRTFREVSELGNEFRHVGEHTLFGRTPSQVALLFDWDNWWACEITDGLNRNVKYLDVIKRYYTALWKINVSVDIVSVDSDLSGYQMVVAPILHMLKADIVDRLEEVESRGGSIVFTFWSGRVDSSDNAFQMDIPGPLKSLCGVRVLETDSAGPDVLNPIIGRDRDTGESVQIAESEFVFEILSPEGAETVGSYGEDFYAGSPAITRNVSAHGNGEIWYVGADINQSGVDWVLRNAATHRGLLNSYSDLTDLEYCVRVHGDERLQFFLNHGTESISVTMDSSGHDLLSGCSVIAGDDVCLNPGGVLVISGPREPHVADATKRVLE